MADVLNVSIAELLRDHEASVREAIPGLSEPDVELLAGVAPCLPGLNETKRKLLLEMIRGFAEVRA